MLWGHLKAPFQFGLPWDAIAFDSGSTLLKNLVSDPSPLNPYQCSSCSRRGTNTRRPSLRVAGLSRYALPLRFLVIFQYGRG